MIWPASRSSGLLATVRRVPAGRSGRDPDGLGTVGECGRPVVDRIVLAAAIGMGLIFVTGVMVGVVLMVAMAIRNPDRRKALAQRPPDAAGLGDMTPWDTEDVWR
jgi:hypothetical protein